MVKVAWKTINGYGPYAYLQKSVKSGGKVTSKHIAYLGAAGLGKGGIALVPGKNFNAPAAEGFPGGRLRIPLVGEETEAKLKGKQKAAIEYMEKQAKAGVATKDIIAGLKALPGKLKRKQKPVPGTGASPGAIKAAAEAAGKPSTGASPAGIKTAAKAAGKPPTGATPATAKLAAKKADGPGFEPKITYEPVDTEGKLLISAENKHKLEAAAAEGIDELESEAKTLSHELKQQTEQSAVATVVLDLKGQLLKGQELGPAVVQDELDKAVIKKVTILEHPPLKSTAKPEAAAAQQPGPAAGPPKVEDIPLDSKGKPLVSKANIEILEKAAAESEFQLKLQTNGIADALKTPSKKAAVFKVGSELMAQLKAAAELNAERETAAEPTLELKAIPKDIEGKPAVSQANIKKLEVAGAKGVKAVDAAAKDTISTLQSPSEKLYVLTAAKNLKKQITGPTMQEGAVIGVAPNKTAKAEMQPAAAAGPPKVTNISLDKKGNALISKTNVKKLEDAAASGFYQLDMTAKNLAASQKAVPKKTAILDAAVQLKVQMHNIAEQQSKAGIAPVAPKVSDVPLNNKGKPLISKANVKKLEAAAAKGIDELDAAAKTISDKLLASTKKAAVLNAAEGLKKKILISNATSILQTQVEEEPAQPATPATATGAVQTGKPTLDQKDHPLVSKANIKKLEAAAVQGVKELDATAKELVGTLKLTKKKTAVLSASWALRTQLLGLQEGDGGSGMSQAMDDVDDGKLKLPKQDTPSLKVMQQQEQKLKSGKKNYNADLEQVSGKKGSNEGGLFKDKKLETLHYVKWPNSPARAKVEALTALLYSYAQVPVPTVRVIKFQGKDAVMSDWLEEAKTMTWTEIAKHKDVRTGFAVDAWLANWDVVGLEADNLVKGPGDKAYRIDVGGSMLFRAQGQPKAFPAHVPELESMRNANIAPQASKAFKNLTPTQLRNGVKKVQAVTDAQIDYAVDSIKLPKKSADYPVSQFGKEANNLPKMLKARLKARRDWLVEEVLEAEKKQAATLAKLQEGSDLKPASVKAIVGKATKYSATSPAASSKWALTGQVMRSELGKTDGDDALEQTRQHWDGWKGSSISAKGAVLRWGAGATTGEGRKELRRMEKFNDFLVKEKQMTKKKAQEHAEYLDKATVGDNAEDLVEGLRITNKQNEVIHSVQNPGEETVTLYRGWKTPQVKYIEAHGSKVGDTIMLEDPPLYSWSLTPAVAKGFGGGHGSFITRAEVPIDTIILSDIANSTGKYGSENEVVFKGVKNLKMEVTKTY